LAIADFTQAIKLDGDDAAAYFLRYRAYNAKGEAAKAKADYDKAIQLDPSLDPAAPAPPPGPPKAPRPEPIKPPFPEKAMPLPKPQPKES
jgi:tetratricopeptide (TPR) repeat protein